MSNELSILDEGAGLPAHLQAQFGGTANTDLSGGVSQGYPVLSYKGKTWTLRAGDQRTVIMRPGTDDEPANALEVVIVKANANLSKVYYAGGYSEGSDEKPVCYSNNGKTPEADAVEPQCGTCAACPRNVWGSRITDSGAKGKQCSDSRRIAVVPSGDLGRAMLLRIPAATLKDLGAYADMLSRRNAPYQAVVTKIAFDPAVAHPKFTFKALRWLDATEAAKVAELMDQDVIGQITGATARGGAQVQQTSELDALGPPPSHVQVATPPQTMAPAAPQQVAAPAPKARANPVAASAGFGGEAPSAAPAPATAAAKPATRKPKANATAPTVDVSAGFGAPLAAAKPAPEPSKAAAKIMEANAELDDVLASLDD